MSELPLASVVVNNYNYGRFLGQAIDSALAQTYPNTEVIVVDDGSTDDSAAIIAGYGPRVVPLIKANGGQTSALNAAFVRSTGEVVVFLDADDALLPTAVEKATDLLRDPEVVHVHWYLLEIDAASRPTGKRVPSMAFPEGNLREAVIARGPDGLVWSSTSGNAWRRSFLEKSFPLATIEKKSRTGAAAADARLSIIAPLYGRVERIMEPQGYYRRHGDNDYAFMAFARKFEFDLLIFDEMCETLAAHCRALEIAFDSEACKQSAWLYRLRQAVAEMRAVIPEGRAVIFIDDETMGLDRSTGLDPIPFLERDGQYIGPPPDDDTAIRELERVRKRGAQYLAVAWPAFWWLEHYRGFTEYLRRTFPCVLKNERLILFDLRNAKQ